MTPEREEALRIAWNVAHYSAKTMRNDVRTLADGFLALAADLEAAEQRLGELDEQRVSAVHALEAADRELREIGRRMSEQVDKLAEDRIKRNRDLATAREAHRHDLAMVVAAAPEDKAGMARAALRSLGEEAENRPPE